VVTGSKISHPEKFMKKSHLLGSHKMASPGEKSRTAQGAEYFLSEEEDARVSEQYAKNIVFSSKIPALHGGTLFSKACFRCYGTFALEREKPLFKNVFKRVSLESLSVLEKGTTKINLDKRRCPLELNLEHSSEGSVRFHQGSI
jgi:hypothetical protein